MTDGRTDGGDCNIPITFLKKKKSVGLGIITLIATTQYIMSEFCKVQFEIT